MAEKYLYEIHPLRPVMNPVEGRFTRRPFSAEFSVEEVKDIMTNARVYRRFPDKLEIEAVTGENLKDLHRPRFDTPKVENAKDDDKQVMTPVEKNTEVSAEPVKEEAPKSIPEPAKVEETEEEVSAEQVSTSEKEVEENVAEEVSVSEIQLSEEVLGGEVENKEIDVDSEEAVSQEPEKEVSENKPANTVYVPNNNKFHNKKKH